jgi:hypothetical protein
MPDVTEPRYFQLDTRDSTFQARTMFANWEAGVAVVYTKNSDDTADVVFVLDVPDVTTIRSAIQAGAIDVVELRPLNARPIVEDIRLNGITDDVQRIERIFSILRG